MRTRSRWSAALTGTALVALLLLAPGAASAEDFGDRTLREGMSGGDVRTLQRKLTRLGIETEADGSYGSETKRSMKRYERQADRTVNGVCTRREAERIKREVRAQRESDAETQDLGDIGGGDSGAGQPRHAYGSRAMGRGDSGTDVAQLQRYLSTLGLPTPVDGRYGSATRKNVNAYEAWRYMRANGNVSRKQARRIRADAEGGEVYRDRAHVFPVRGSHSYGSSASRFGAPRSGHTHQGQDVAANAGTKLVAVHDGRVAVRQYQAGGAGHYLVIRGADGSDSVYMHMPRRSFLEPGDRVLAGEAIGAVGSTGASSGPHLHFELWTPHWYNGGRAYDPLPDLKRWDRRT